VILQRFGANRKASFVFVLVFLLVSGPSCKSGHKENDSYITYEVDLNKQDLRLYWKDDGGQLFRSIGNLRTWLNGKGKRLLFAMNGGIYDPGNSPQGLFIQEKGLVVPLNTSSGKGNFYMKPNGVFYTTTDHRAVICRTEDYSTDSAINYATQSGPMLLVDDVIHPAFVENSSNLNIRNGVGILPDGKIVFAMSKRQVNLYDFAAFFKKWGCKNALYLDGFVSRTYLPGKGWEQLDGNFGVIIAVQADR
jgi:uncharacterized protein YigE (DUF2233 family)